jgi:hypothetical protein
MTARLIGTALIALVAAGPLKAQDPVPVAEFVFEEIVHLGPAQSMGETARGTRQMIPITGGTFEGTQIRGTIVPGGWDWQLRRADGCTEIEADYMIRTDDDVMINVVNKGVLCPPRDGAPSPVRTHPVFEAPRGKYEWLSQAAFIGTLEMATGTPEPAVRIRFYRMR